MAIIMAVIQVAYGLRFTKNDGSAQPPYFLHKTGASVMRQDSCGYDGPTSILQTGF